jgi:glycosyltransferase involved in cell wall biosynthesis
MRLFLFAVGGRDRASSRLRVWDHLAWLRGGYEEVIADSGMAAGVRGLTLGFFGRFALRYPLWLVRFFRADGILIQESLALWPAMLLKNLGKHRHVLFDFSDPVDRIGGGLQQRIRARLFDLMVRRADAVMVENKLYLDHVGGRARQILHFYGPVNASRYLASRERRAAAGAGDALRIGWTGSPGTFHLIAPLLPAIDTLGGERAVELLLIGVDSVPYIFSHAKLCLAAWTEDGEFDLVPSFDLGLFRLDDSENARWRGAGKLFIYMAAGVPLVASDTGIAGTLMQESGIGFPVSEDGAWLSVLRAAADDAELRRRFAERSLHFARDNFSYELYRDQLARQFNAQARECVTQ